MYLPSKRQCLGASLVLAMLFSGCRTRADKTEEEPEIDPTAPPKAAGQVTGPVPPGTPAEEADAGPGTGPKLMGWQYFTRTTLSLTDGKYSDEQVNHTTSRERQSEDVAMKGQRITIEHYPLVIPDFPKSIYGYSLIELRQEKPAASYWEERNTFMLLGGFILPFRRIIAPVVGIIMEFNKMDMGAADSPEVAKSDVRAYVVGTHFRQKIWGQGDYLGFYHQGRVHLINPTFVNYGAELEWGLGTMLSYGFFTGEVAMSYSYQIYRARREADITDSRNLFVKSDYSSLLTSVILWL